MDINTAEQAATVSHALWAKRIQKRKQINANGKTKLVQKLEIVKKK